MIWHKVRELITFEAIFKRLFRHRHFGAHVHDMDGGAKLVSGWLLNSSLSYQLFCNLRPSPYNPRQQESSPYFWN